MSILGFMFHIIETNETVPLILADENRILQGFKNTDTIKIAKDDYLKRELAR